MLACQHKSFWQVKKQQHSFKLDLNDIDHRTHLTIEFKKIKFNVYVLYNK